MTLSAENIQKEWLKLLNMLFKGELVLILGGLNSWILLYLPDRQSLTIVSLTDISGLYQQLGHACPLQISSKLRLTALTLCYDESFNSQKTTMSKSGLLLQFPNKKGTCWCLCGRASSGSWLNLRVYSKIPAFRPPFRLSKSGLKDHVWTVPKVLSF